MRFPLQVKLWILLAIASSVPLAGLALATLPVLSGLLHERAVQLLRLRAEAVTQQIQGLVDRGREDVLVLSRLHAVRARLGQGSRTAPEPLQAEVEAALVVFASNRPAYDAVSISDASGVEFARIARQDGVIVPVEPMDPGADTAYQVVECRGLFDGLVHVAATGWSTRPIVRYCTGVYGEAPRRLGHAVLELPGEQLLRTLDPELASARVQLCDAAGALLAERLPDGHLALGGPAPTTVFAGQSESGARNQAQWRVTADTVEVDVPVRSNPDRGRPGWWVRVTAPSALVFEPATRLLRGGAAAVAIMLVLALLVGTRAASQATAPLSALSTAARRLARGDWSARPRIDTGDEIQHLAEDFGAMADELMAKEARLLEQQHLLHRSERLALLGRFAAEVAHEVGNPLAAIKASLQAMQEEGVPVQSTDPRLERLVREVDRLDKILRGLLSSARRRPEPGTACDGAAVAATVTGLMQAQAARAGVALALEVPEGLPRLCVDGERLQQVLFNLLANALEATPEGGRVTLALSSDAGAARLAVSDTGRGIPEADRARLFEPFFTTRPGGTGLGLAVAEQIVRESGGKLSVDSTPGVGSTFTVELPVEEARKA